MATKPVASTTPETAENETALKNRLTDQAMRQVRDAHRDEFTKIITDLFKEHGLEYKPRLSKEQRAAEQIKRLAAEAGIDLGVLADEVADEEASLSEG